jgi:hypothetical protein
MPQKIPVVHNAGEKACPARPQGFCAFFEEMEAALVEPHTFFATRALPLPMSP